MNMRIFPAQAPRRLDRLQVAGIVCLLLAAGPAIGAEAPVPAIKPLWEVGILGGAAHLPHYRGSDEYSWYFLPLPFVVYRGRILQVDREAIRGIFYKGDRLETEISFFGNPPADSDDQAREGMPGLQAIGEAGPALKFYLHRRRLDPSVFLKTTVRGAVAADFQKWSSHYVGIRGGLSLSLEDFRPVPDGIWSGGMSAGVDINDSAYDRYFYDVQPDQIRPGRGAFQSHGGYAGFSLSGYALARLLPALSWGVYVRWDNIDGAVYRASPLVRSRNNHVFGTALIWTINKSKRQVSIRGGGADDSR
ncbi:MAG: MipA/OmpV family protein [Elusimicrobia bacterium]|nr:MipA/OmpV family protein [Elusimicrobiota bacterium]